MEDEADLAALIDNARDNSTIINGEALPVVQTSVTLSHLLKILSLPRRLTTLASLTPLSFPPTANQPSLHPPTTSILSVLHLRALECLNNLLLTTAVSLSLHPSLASQIPAPVVWDSMMSIIMSIGAEPDALGTKGQEMRIEMLEMALGCLWGIAKIAPSRLVSRYPLHSPR